MPESIDVTIDHARGPSAPWGKPAIRERTWREAVGGRIADRARPVELIRGTLMVRVATSVWASELSLLSEQLIARLCERGVPVTSVRFHVGPVERYGDPPDPRQRRAVPASVALPGELEMATLAVSDDELRECIAGAARANLAWQNNLAPQCANGSAAARPSRPPRDGGVGYSNPRPNEVSRGARAPRDAGIEIDRQDRASAAFPEASPRTHGASSRRST